MKIRIKGNSLRYRLTKTDVEILASKGYLEERTNFGEQTLIYAVKRASVGRLEAVFKDNSIVLLMPDSMASELTTTDRIGFEDTSGQLYLLIEKDFKCLDSVAEDQSDNYPNPREIAIE